MHRDEALALLRGGVTGHLATVRPDGRPHIVVVTFVLVANRIATALDHKPKKTRRLQRLTNIEHNPAVSFLVDRYEDDWDRLWWVRVDGEAEVVDGERERHALDVLVEKYPQYQDRRPEGPVISISIDRVIGWSSTR